MLQKVILVILLFSAVSSFSQTWVNELVKEPEDIFIRYLAPETPHEFIKYCRNAHFQAIYVAVFVQINKKGEVDTLTFSRLQNIGNNIEDDSIWLSCEHSIIEASKYWIFKPLSLNEIQKHNLSNPIKENEITSSIKQNHLIIFEFLDSFEARAINRTYLLIAK